MTSGAPAASAVARHWTWAATASAPTSVSAARVIDTAPGADGGDLRLAATLALPGDALAQLDVALDYPRRDELEIVGTAGKITIPDPWLCRRGFIELERGGMIERMPADPTGQYHLGDHTDPDNDDAYRIESRPPPARSPLGRNPSSAAPTRSTRRHDRGRPHRRRDRHHGHPGPFRRRLRRMSTMSAPLRVGLTPTGA